MSDESRDAGYDDFLDAVEDGEPYYLESPSGNGWLPPRAIDPETGETTFTERPLPEPGELLTYSEAYVAAPDFAEDAPFVVAVAEFGPVRITGQIRGMNADDLEIGQAVSIDVDTAETTGDRLLVFRPD
ncbi:MAG: Zn-ribbon domain-containing OB-fold protein [Halodesulfurarchaeum sp.]